MEPTLFEGDCVLVKRIGLDALRSGDLVIARDPRNPKRLWIKRVGSTAPGSFAVVSDNPLEASDSRQVGSLRAEHLVGIPTLAIAGDGRLKMLTGATRI